MCDNVVTRYTPKGREVPLRCGRTGFHGERIICDECRNDPHEMAEIERHERMIEADNAWLRSAGWGEM